MLLPNRFLALVSLSSLPLLAQSTAAGRTGAAASAPQLGAAPQQATSAPAAPVPATNANRDTLLSPSDAATQFRAQRTNALDNPGFSASVAPGSAVPISGVTGAPAGTVIGGQVLEIVPGTSVTIRDLSGVVQTFPLPASFTIPSDVTTGTFVALTTMDGGFVTLANASGVLPSSAVTGGTGATAPNLTQIAAANGSLVSPNLTTQQVPAQSAITGIGGFYAVGALPVPASAEATSTSGAVPGPGSGAISPTAPTGIPAAGPMTSISYSDVSLATAAARAAGTRRLPATAARGTALATIDGAGGDIVTHTALPTWRVVSWDGTVLVVQDDHGRRSSLTIDAGTIVPRNLQPGKLVVLGFRNDESLRGVRYVL